MRNVSSKTIDGITDLVVVAPIKHGVIEAFENLTYESRLSLVAEALHKIRVNAREHETTVPFADTVERILTLLNFRIGIIDKDTLGADYIAPEYLEEKDRADASESDRPPQRYMFLTATFDSPLEPYLRLIWDPLGPFLDLLLCNCEGYKFATEVGFPEYLDWVRDHQVEPAIFYSTTPLTVRDQIYLPQLEKLVREGCPASSGAASDRQIASLSLEDPETSARKTWYGEEAEIRTAFRLSFEALNVLYRLADYFPPEKPEGRILLRATRDLLKGLDGYVEGFKKHPVFKEMLNRYGVLSTRHPGPFTEQWRWFLSGKDAQPKPPNTPTIPSREIQKGLLSPYQDDQVEITHSAVLMFAVRHPNRAAMAIKTLFEPTFEDQRKIATPGGFWNYHTAQGLAFTPHGLRRMGLSESALSEFPREFVEGLFERAPMLGDVQKNHPRRWDFPLRRDLFCGNLEDTDRPAVHTEEIDFVFQLRIARNRNKDDSEQPPSGFIDYETETLELEARIRAGGLLERFHQEFDAIFAQLELEADSSKPANPSARSEAQDVRPATPFERFRNQLSTAFERADDLRENKDDSLGLLFALYDPISVKILLVSLLQRWLGVRLLAVESGHRYLEPCSEGNSVNCSNRDHFGFIDGISQPRPDVPDGGVDHVQYGDILAGLPNSRGDDEGDLSDYQNAGPIPLTYGSYMVLRKIEQYPDRLEDLKSKYSADVGEMIVGRRMSGEPLIEPRSANRNDFDFHSDPKQDQCPFSAHIRLANPRDDFQGRPAPRILRRGMSYGDPYDLNNPASNAEKRGLLFIAYNASLAEQYEVIQRWLNRGNPTGVSSAANDPLTGVEQSGGGHTFRFKDRKTGSVERVHIEKPLTELKYGLYAFVPSRSGIDAICEMAANANQTTRQQRDAAAIDVEAGRDKIERLLRLGYPVQRHEWKRLIEDAAVKDPAKGNELPEVWEAIRKYWNGVLRLKSGIAFGGGSLPSQESKDEGNPVVLLTNWSNIEDVLSDPEKFSVVEQGRRTSASFGDIFVAMDPDPADTETNRVSRYAKEAIETNKIVMNFGARQSDSVFETAYKLTQERLLLARKFSATTNISPGKPPFYKVELRRDLLVPVLGQLCKWLFDIPDADLRVRDKGYIDLGPWGAVPVDPDGNQSAGPGLRKPRCPADFMAPSRRSFYPRPTGAIIDYGTRHGHGLRAASKNFVTNRVATGCKFAGQLSSPMEREILPKQGPGFDAEDLLARNIIGLMEGMLPPTDGLMRGIVFDWIDRNEIWHHQSSYIDKVRRNGHGLRQTREALEGAVHRAIRKRPAPDLIYRTAMEESEINGQTIAKGDLVILALGAAMQDPSPNYKADIWPVFGGYRQKPLQAKGTPSHACPAQPIVMAMIYGMLAALFDAGRIVVQPASLIVRISDWPGPAPQPTQSPSDCERDIDAGEDDGPFSPFT